MSSAALGTSAAEAANRRPTIRGTPATVAPRDKLYSFSPQAADADGDRLTFSIVGKPRWMWFDTRTGRLRGLPKRAQQNRTFPGIVIRVSDGKSLRALPAFSIRVSAATGGGGTANSPPTISGVPSAQALVGTPFNFRPRSADANGDTLRFSIVNKPEWAQFSTTSGALSGTPMPRDVRSYGNITIRVSDGVASTSLQPFALTVVPASDSRTVTLNWSLPTDNTDGTVLTDLAGYKLFYGMASRQYSMSAQVQGAAVQSIELQNLAAGTWYFAIKSVNRAGVESDISGEVRAVL